MTAIVDLKPAALRLSELVQHIDDDYVDAPTPSGIPVAGMLDHVGGLAMAKSCSPRTTFVRQASPLMNRRRSQPTSTPRSCMPCPTMPLVAFCSPRATPRRPQRTAPSMGNLARARCAV
jgi:hypothetical protein